jgi:hypothetical protein
MNTPHDLHGGDFRHSHLLTQDGQRLAQSDGRYTHLLSELRLRRQLLAVE